MRRPVLIYVVASTTLMRTAAEAAACAQTGYCNRPLSHPPSLAPRTASRVRARGDASFDTVSRRSARVESVGVCRAQGGLRRVRGCVARKEGCVESVGVSRARRAASSPWVCRAQGGLRRVRGCVARKEGCVESVGVSSAKRAVSQTCGSSVPVHPLVLVTRGNVQDSTLLPSLLIKLSCRFCPTKLCSIV